LPWQEEHEDLLKRIEILKNENSAATKTLVTYSEECLKLTDENDSIEVHHFNFVHFYIIHSTKNTCLVWEKIFHFHF